LGYTAPGGRIKPGVFFGIVTRAKKWIPAMRTIFGIFFLYNLFERIKSFALSDEYEATYSSGWLFTAIFILGVLSRLPAPYGLVSFLAFLFYIPPFENLNYAIQNSGEYDYEIKNAYNTRQVILIVIGSILWLAIIYSFFK
jgi:hypothetical protein